MSIWDIIVWIGILRFSYLVLQWLYFNYYCKLNINDYKYGWIVITGASDGIGKAISLQLAIRGFKIVLVSRNKEKLEKVTKELISASSNTNIKYVVADFTYSHRNPEEFYGALMKELSAYDISGLINNVGVLYFDYLAEQDLDKIEAMLGINVYPQTLLSYHILPKFIERYNSTKQRSLLVNFSSAMDLVTFPSTSVYSATKRYSDFLSEGIRLEYSHAVDVATVKPGLVDTNLTNSSHGNGLNWMPLTAEVNSWAKSFISNLHKGINYGHWKHSLVVFLATLLPYQIMNAFTKLAHPLLVKLQILKH